MATRTKTTVLNQAFVDKVRSAINSTWQEVGGDLSMVEGYKDEPSGNLEVCLDADYMSMYGGKDGKEIQVFLRKAYEEHGYDEVFKFLLKNIRLGL